MGGVTRADLRVWKACSLCCPGKYCLLLHQHIQRLHYVSKPFDESPIVRTETDKASDISDGLGRWPPPWLLSSSGKWICQQLRRYGPRIPLETGTDDTFWVNHVLLESFTENDNVVTIYQTNLPVKTRENELHQSFKRRGSVSQAKGHLF